MAGDIVRLTVMQKSRIEKLKKEFHCYKVFEVTKNSILKCNYCSLEMNFRDSDNLNRHLKSARHENSRKLQKVIRLYERYTEDNLFQR